MAAAMAATNVAAKMYETQGKVKMNRRDNATKRTQIANDYAASLRSQQRSTDPTFGMSENEFASLTKYDRADRAMDTTDRGLSLIERNWKAVIIIFVLVLVLYFVFRSKIQSFVGELVGKIKNSSVKNDIETENGVKATISDSEIAILANDIEATISGMEDSEQEVANLICKCQNQTDWDLLKLAYGTRRVRQDWFGWFNTDSLSLVGIIQKVFDQRKPITTIYNHFLSHRIKDDVLLNFLQKNS